MTILPLQEQLMIYTLFSTLHFNELTKYLYIKSKSLCLGSFNVSLCELYASIMDYEKLKAAEEDEILTLKEEAIKPTTHSRLGCQVELKKEHNNITVTIAPD